MREGDELHPERSPQGHVHAEDIETEGTITVKNKTNDRERIEMKKYCRWERRHTLHKETR